MLRHGPSWTDLVSSVGAELRVYRHCKICDKSGPPNSTRGWHNISLGRFPPHAPNPGEEACPRNRAKDDPSVTKLRPTVSRGLLSHPMPLRSYEGEPRNGERYSRTWAGRAATGRHNGPISGPSVSRLLVNISSTLNVPPLEEEQTSRAWDEQLCRIPRNFLQRNLLGAFRAKANLSIESADVVFG